MGAWNSRPGARAWAGVALLAVGLAAAAALAQQKTTGLVQLPDEQAIDVLLSEMLAAWQIGDVELLRKYCADDIVVVSGLYEPPLAGWANYAAAYRQQRQRMQQVRLDRRNTFVHVKGHVAWASYQWEFSALVEGRPSAAQGHTTVILEKQKDRWLIVHNHTSVVTRAQGPEPAPPPEPSKP